MPERNGEREKEESRDGEGGISPRNTAGKERGHSVKVDNPGSRRNRPIGRREILNVFFTGNRRRRVRAAAGWVGSSVSPDVYERLTLSKCAPGSAECRGGGREDGERERSRSLAVSLIGYVAHAPS